MFSKHRFIIVHYLSRHNRRCSTVVTATTATTTVGSTSLQATTTSPNKTVLLHKPSSRYNTLRYNYRAFSSSPSSSSSSFSSGEITPSPPPPPPSPLPITSFTEDEIMIQEAVRSWSKQVLNPIKVRQMDNESKICPIVLKDLFTQGFMGIEIDPEKYDGGSGLSFTSSCIIIEELARMDPSIAILVDIHNTCIINAIRCWGSKQLKKQFLSKLATTSVSSFCLSESESGSDAFSLKTTAIQSKKSKAEKSKSNDNESYHYIINGTKMWISNAKDASTLLVFANVAPSLGYKGITAFVLDKKNGTITIGIPEKKLGLKASSTCTIHFENVKIPSSQILGEIGFGYKYCIEILNEGRIGIAAQQLGIAKACLYDIALPYMKERKQFNTSISEFQGMEHQYAQIATEIHAVELMTYNACRRKEHGMPFIKEASMVKLYSAQIAEKTASKTIEWLGGIGYTQDVLAEKFYRDCKVGSIYEGTTNIELQTIAKLLRSE
ncbi:acyl CoA dehydrogenase [Fragilariopsis cylindrus CCMP1102]|uniref:short-chain 2-methylacyl-CoA dehydrogenase n=1 Tax=Fragilariopsis cylindrus CCMP1102 TaxID=635003 RepID=A0A1E7F9Y1_9STRA|nr:acyl CoA dehydrogenase [Fragilariopsis cylindrus CCMP1102]|eukprot:OEU14981.1 acyl CoA dehydrogenase [Fragilariopsis cylindrus CCMP1102]